MNSLLVVIVNHNSTDYLETCLKTLHAETAPANLQVAVVDNASDCQDFTGLEQAFPSVQFLLNSTNKGFAGACNQALQQFSADTYLLLNPDCEILDRAVDRCRKFLENHPECGIVGCQVLNSDGTLQKACRRRIPRPAIALYRLLGLSLLFPQSRRLAAYNYGDVDSDRMHEVESVSGSFLMFRHRVLEDIGSLDERFFLYGEDLDFCYRALQAGWKIFYFPGARVIHHQRRSSSRSPRLASYHFYRSMELFYEKHFQSRSRLPERLLVKAGIRLLELVTRSRLNRKWLRVKKRVSSLVRKGQ